MGLDNLWHNLYAVDVYFSVWYIFFCRVNLSRSIDRKEGYISPQRERKKLQSTHSVNERRRSKSIALMVYSNSDDFRTQYAVIVSSPDSTAGTSCVVWCISARRVPSSHDGTLMRVIYDICQTTLSLIHI